MTYVNVNLGKSHDLRKAWGRKAHDLRVRRQAISTPNASTYGYMLRSLPQYYMINVAPLQGVARLLAMSDKCCRFD